ncbi:MAG: nuclear transport factor 2 family protein [Acidimicrobiales bacterium]
MDSADRLELHELPGRYGDAIDDRDWERLGRIFTEDATFDLTDLGGPKLEGLAEIKRYMDEEAQHPQTHLMTNIYVDEAPDRVTLRFRIVALRRDKPVASGNYYDTVVKTPAGWRVKDRVFTIRRRDRKR